MHTMTHVVEGCDWYSFGDSRANLVEPALGFALREIEMAHQRGEGAGHGLVAVLEVIKH